MKIHYLLPTPTNLFSLLTVLFAGLAPCPAQVEKAFVRITETEDITPDGIYLIGNINEKDCITFLTSEKTEKNKMTGILIGKDSTPQESYTTSQAQAMWQFEWKDKKSLKIKSFQSGNYLTRSNNSSTNLTTTATASTNSLWTCTITDNGTFVMSKPEENDRHLCACVDFFDYTKNYYGVYKSGYKTPYDLYIYKLTHHATDPSGNATMPNNGDWVALTYGTKAFSLHGPAFETKNHQLCDGKLAPDNGFTSWKAQVHDANHVSLQNEEGYLGYELTASSSPVKWVFKQGKFYTEETPERILCYDETSQNWTVNQADIATRFATLTTLADQPDYVLSTQGVCTLKGGWNVEKLAGFKAEELTCLDLTSIALPVFAQAFGCIEGNIPIFVDSQMRDYVPASWNFVVACSIDNQLLKMTTLVDKVPFYTDRPIQITNDGMLSYTRNADNAKKWQTLCIPFDATISAGKAYCLTDASNGVLTFEKANYIRAGKAYIILPDTNGNISLKSKPGILQTEVLTDNQTLIGTFKPITVESETPPVYFLHPISGSFKKAATQSYLPPFRCYLKTGNGSSSYSVRLAR